MRKVISNIFIIILIVILLFVLYCKYIKKDKIISLFGYNFFIVLTGSMEPEIPVESFIIVKKERSYEIR